MYKCLNSYDDKDTQANNDKFHQQFTKNPGDT
jgi:hypothetical protein